MQDADTICAISTGSYEAAIAVIRLSGRDSFDIVKKLFRPASGKAFSKLSPRRMYFGTIEEGGEWIDEVMLSLFENPHSYTGEDMAEISCHGSLYIQQRILDAVTRHGARMAEPGEFTKRAFLKGKMQLDQAEAVADLIASDSKASHDLAIRHMKQGYGKEIEELREGLLKLVSLMELELDFGEEDVEFADREELLSMLRKLKERIGSLLESFRYGNVLKRGMPVVIAGKPNVGKSTLLNALLKEDRAIVSEIPGTTRDSLEDEMVIDGIRFRFIDTAGLRTTSDVIEGEGVRRTYNKLSQAGIILLMAETAESEEEVTALVQDVRKRLPESNAGIFLVRNKSDIQAASRKDNLPDGIPGFSLSAKTGDGMEALITAMQEEVRSMKTGDLVVSNARHAAALQNALEAAERAEAAMQENLPGDLVSQDIREVLHHLGEITGHITTDEVLGRIFKDFCIGK